MKNIFTFLFLLAISSGAFAQTTWIVRESAGNGVDFTSIKDALVDNQVQTGDILDILGTFTEANIVLSKGLTFKGHGESQTIIQAAADKYEGAGRVFYHDNVDGVDNASIEFHDLTIRNGNTTVGSYPWAGWGSAMFFLGQVDVVMNNVTITNNLGAGNGIIYFWGRSLTMDNCEVVDNEAITGRCGGLYLWFQQGYDIEVNVTKSLFANNKANDHSGALAIMKANDTGNNVIVNFENTTFYNNAAFSGSVFWAEAGNSTGDLKINMTNCSMVDNTNTQFGWHGIANFWAPTNQMTFNAKNNFFKGNTNSNGPIDASTDYADFMTPTNVEALQFYPNPVNDKINVRNVLMGSYSICALTGNVVQEGILNGNTIVVELLKQGNLAEENSLKVNYLAPVTKGVDVDGNYDGDRCQANLLFYNNIRYPVYMKLGYVFYDDKPYWDRTYQILNPEGNKTLPVNTFWAVIHGVLITKAPNSIEWKKDLFAHIQPNNDGMHIKGIKTPKGSWSLLDTGTETDLIGGLGAQNSAFTISDNKTFDAGQSFYYGIHNSFNKSLEAGHIGNISFCKCVVHGNWEIGGGMLDNSYPIKPGQSSRLVTRRFGFPQGELFKVE